MTPPRTRRTWLGAGLRPLAAGLAASLLVAGALLIAGNAWTGRALAQPAPTSPPPVPSSPSPALGQGIAALVAADGTASASPRATAADPAPPPPSTPAQAPAPRPSSPAGMKLWSDGDSVSYFLTTNLVAILSAHGAEPVRSPDYKISSRLTAVSGSSAVLHVPFAGWFSYMPDEMERYDPDLVVFMVGANDAGFADPERFGERAAAMMDLLRRDGRVVVWVGLPSFTRADLASSAPALNAASRDAAAGRDWVVFVDTSSIAPDGNDGVHFSPGHGRRLAEAVIRAMFPNLAVD